MTPAPPRLATRLLQPGEAADFAALTALFAQVFERATWTPPGNDHLNSVLAAPHFLAMVAMVDARVVGGLTAYILDGYYTAKPQAYLYDIAVHPGFQRQGIGRRLLTAFTAHCTEAGFEEIFVQADAEDAHALEFYRAMGTGREAAVVHFSYELHGGDARAKSGSAGRTA